MKAILAVCSFIAVSGVIEAQDPNHAAPTPWGQIRMLLRERRTDADTYLKSLTPEEMLTAARQACDERAAYKGDNTEATPEGVAEMDVMLCLHYYFDKVDRDEGGAALLKIVRDRSESPLLRRALISRMWNAVDEAFDVEFQANVKANQADVTELLTRLLQDKGEPWLVRKESMDYLAHQIVAEVGKITRSDPNARAVWERTHTFAFVGKMLRSGELTLTQETVKALEPLEARALAYVKLLGAILADENEPKELRKHARRKVEGCRRSALTGIDDEVKKALRDAAD